MATILIPTPLRPYAKGLTEVGVEGKTVGEALESLVARYPDMGKHLYDHNGQLRAFVNLSLGEDHINDLRGLKTPLSEKDRLRIIPSIAGGIEAVSR